MRKLQWFLTVALISMVGVNAEAADKAKKKKTDDTVPAGYSKVTFVDLDKNTFNVSGDDTKYTFTDKTTNYEKIAIGAVVKVTLADGSKTSVAAVDVSADSATPAKKKKKNANNNNN
jgi:hypothetical protein